MSKKLMKAAIAATLLGLTSIVVTSGQAQAEKTLDKEPFPADALPAGAGYVLNKPDQTGRWEVVGLYVDAEPDYRQPGR
jgi:hypothetical protein